MNWKELFITSFGLEVKMAQREKTHTVCNEETLDFLCGRSVYLSFGNPIHQHDSGNWFKVIEPYW